MGIFDNLANSLGAEIRKRKRLYRFYLPLAAAVLLLGFGLAVWRVSRDESEVNRGLVALRLAYQNQRPTEARLTDFNYAPVFRGGSEKVDNVQRDLAGRLLLGEVAKDRPGAAAHRGGGQYYFASRQFDKAVDQFKAAIQLDPNDAKTHSDLAAALLELGKLHASESGQEAAIQNFAESLQHVNKALELNSSLTEALFNRSVLYRHMKLSAQAADDWLAYLALDANSRWADEARHNLEAIQQQRKVSSQSRQDLFQQFQSAYTAEDENTAWKLVSSYHNRSGNVVFEQAVDAYIEAVAHNEQDHAQTALLLMSYAGELEKQRAGETYFLELARFYVAAPKERLARLKNARTTLKIAHEGWGRLPVADSLAQFTQAEALFAAASDQSEAMFAEYWICFCLYQQHHTEQAWAKVQPVLDIAQRKYYRWLSVRMLYLSSILQYDLTNYSQALRLAEQSLALAEKTDDAVGKMNGLSSLIEYYRYLSHFDKSLSYIQRSLPLLGETSLDPIQGCRHYGFVATSLASTGWYDAAAAYQKEALQYAFKTALPATISINLAFFSQIESRLKKFDDALSAARRALQVAEESAGDRSAKDRMAYASLQIAHVYRQAGSCDKAIESYDRAIELYHELNYYTQIYQGHKGRLLCYLAKGDSFRAEQEISTALGLVESYRGKIFEDTNRETFFDAEQSVYDIAIGFQYATKASPERAFEYSEFSRGRSLLDLVNSDSRVFDRTDKDLVLNRVTHPLSAEEIKQRLPTDTQLVQFAVLDNQLIIWLISRKQISSTTVPVSREQLQEKITSYLRLITSASANESNEVARQARELYDLLIKPLTSLLDSSKQLCIVPDKVLNLLPFSTLISTTSGKYLLQDYVLSVSPSATMAVLLSENARSKMVTNGETILSVGNPRFDRSAYPSLPDLPSAAWEASVVADLYPAARLLVDDGPSAKAVVSEMQNANVIHLALHSVVDDRFPTRSKLLMANVSPKKADGEASESALFAYDIYGLNLTRARLAVLSACETGTGRYFGGEGVINMARPFLVAGVPLVVASLWPVESNSTAKLMVDFHRLRTKERLTTAQALQQAQLRMLHDPDERLHQPYYWAPFVLIGGYAKF